MSTTPGKVMRGPDALAPGTQVGRWRVVEQLGVGGQGAVYRVEDLDHPGDFYALKLALHARHARAEREGELMMGRAAHPNVVRFHGCARWPHPREGCLGLLMDWVPGLALDVWAEREGTTFRQLLAASATVARTLGELHGRGVLHRDLKPEHILIRESDGEPVLLDFGVGWYEGARPLTTGPLPPATLYLLTPEAVRFLWDNARRPGANYACRPTDDLYALGVCLYRATTGHYPFPEWLPMDVLQLSIVQVRPMAPALVNPRVPRALSDLIVRLLAKDPGERYPSGEALHAALAAMANQEAAWDADIFAWEDVPPVREGDASERELVRPPRPRPSWSTMPPVPARRRSRWSERLLIAAGLLLWLTPGASAPPVEPHMPVPKEAWDADARLEQTPLSADQAPLPVKEQKRAPCTEGVEVELSSACWRSLEHQSSTCPRLTFSYKGKCFLPVLKARAVPTSVDGGVPEGR